jgi:CRP/FNR family cyclic AMP-dependent transcriptional regulator
LKKNYEGYTFNKYWNEVLPDRIRKYQRTGYLQWLVPQEVTKSERDEAKEFEIFRGLKPSEIFLLLKTAKTIEFEPEEVILREGAIGENFYLILEGEVEVRRGHFSKPGSWHQRIGRGSVLGELAFLLHVPRSMTVVAATPCKLIEIDQDQFNELLEANLTAPYKLIKNIAVIMAERLFQLTLKHEKLLETQELNVTGETSHG